MGSDKDRSALADSHFLRGAHGLKDPTSDLTTEGLFYRESI